MSGPTKAEQFADWTYYPELLARPVPRYTSYPTAAEFVEESFELRQRISLASLTGPVSIYLHIPYCEEICWYCGCNTGAANKRHRLTAYLEALHREIALVADMLDPSVHIEHIAFGGGSPNAVPPTEFVRLIDALVLAFRFVRPALSVELDPRTLTRDWLTAIRGIGVTRVSLGVQTLNPAVQEAIGRVQPIEMIERAVSGLRAAGVGSINFDLMYGLPHQNDEVLAETLAQSVAMGPNRIALFGYAHVPHMIPRQRRIDGSDLPDQRGRFRMAAMGARQLIDAGYHAVGFDHFALPGDPLARAAMNGTLRRNFQGFTEDPASVLIGLGASAISELPGLMVQNEKNPGRYRMLIGADKLTGRKGIETGPEDARRAAIIEALLCKGAARIDGDLLAAARPRLEPFAKEGLVTLERGWLRLEADAAPYARAIASVFDAYRTEERSFSSAI
ncbi:oxygen-independent coproporphyrinogen III oxidase [Novosphingobium sp.]|uniref:oxygen-independent coproporphyrinogen III oxidase n=1 Tax=Novosphingobium sp. TaxID=1874826 RepID=UPI00260754FC|nr:oxygen-independent coproporphyrinogen III oxidase [Novosphingobium sp.]